MKTDRPAIIRMLLRRFPRRDALLEAAVYLTVALVITWPLAAHLTSALPIGSERVPTVPLFNVWTIWWNAESAAHGFADYWKAPIFAPATDAFAFSETQPATLLVAPFVWLFRTPITAYNVYLLASLVANGWAGSRVIAGATGRRSVGIAGGLMIELLPLVHWQIGILQLVPLWGICWTIHALRRFSEEPGYRRGLLLAAAFVTTHLLCHHYSLFLALLLVPAGLWLPGKNLWKAGTWLKLAPGCLLLAMTLGPLIVIQQSILESHDWKRPRALVESLSAEPADYATAPGPQFLSLQRFADRQRFAHWKLGVGSLALMLALAGLAYGFANTRLRRWTGFSLTLLVLSVGLSFGPKLNWGAWQPYDWLVAAVPGFAQLRNVFRFAVPAQLGLVFLAANGLAAIGCAVNRLSRAKSRRLPTGGESEGGPSSGPQAAFGRMAAVVVLLLGGFAAFEAVPRSQPLYDVPPIEKQQGWIDWLRTNTPPDAVVACLPFPTRIDVWQNKSTALWMYWGTFHRRRLANGYSGFFPESYYRLHEHVQTFPDAEALAALKRAGVRYCVVDLSDRAAVDNKANPHLTFKFRDKRAGVAIYEMR